MRRSLSIAAAVIALATASASCSTSQGGGAVNEARSGATRSASPSPPAEPTESATPEEPAEPTSESPPEPEVSFEHGAASKRAPVRLPRGELPRGGAAVIDVTGYRTYHVEVPAPLASNHIRCRVNGSDTEGDRLRFQVSTQPGLIDDNYLDEDEYSLDDDEFLFTTQSWSEGTYRRVFSSVYTSADDERLYIDENQNGMQIDNPNFRYEFSDDFKILRLSIGGLSIDDTTWETGKVTINAVVRCQ